MSIRSFISRLSGRSNPAKIELQPWQREILDRFDDFLKEEVHRRLEGAVVAAPTMPDKVSKMIDEIVTRGSDRLPLPMTVAQFEDTVWGSTAIPLKFDDKLVGRQASVMILDDLPQSAPETAEVAAASAIEVETHQVKTKSRIVGQRFRRSREEIRLGLTPEQARLRRQVAKTTKLEGQMRRLKPIIPKSATVRTKMVEVPVERPVSTGVDLLDMLKEPVRSRAKLVVERQREGKTDVLKTADLDAEIARRVAAGQVTKLPAGLDSAGYQHFPGY